ncbi:electron transport complex protein RnfG [Desulfonispora thiosulfatigenes DSM 11270]|uniref:Ion-translocating oxidoreductase complex subunit G n=1 Tax=Desulfonispora thiosulfatigenes DSM 11270 TaxID=656914 RepID=A0A1W1UIR5_DESTI|nr:RnfABCDGE type electron transport complex subunit G [Desulfonispora thiosulfatigenes]SMB81015.1 electron transport complex protein RnfG [Desulfonispora thiosulfatigenes DSM 11270]
MREVIKLGLFLLSVCVLVGFSTSYVNELTKPIILEKERVTQEEGLKEVFVNADEIKDETEKYLESTENSVIKQVNVALKEGKQLGAIYLVEPRGYSSNLKILVGFDIANREITNIKVLSQAETPGLGAQVEEAWFAERFKGKSAKEDLEIVKNPAKEDNEIEAITASTITSKAVAHGVNEARKHFEENFK